MAVRTEIGAEAPASRTPFSPAGSVSATDTQRAIEAVSAVANNALSTANNAITAVVDDTAPELGGNLDAGGFDISGADNISAVTGTFSGDVTVADEAYGSGWNGSFEVPTKNAVYDKIETISAVGITDVVQDTTPQLGGNLDLNSHNITGTGNISTTGAATITGALKTGDGSAGTPGIGFASEATGMYLFAAGTLLWGTAGTGRIVLNSSGLRPASNDQLPLGAATIGWSDLFLASGGVLNWNNGNATLTHSTGLLTSSVPLSLGTSNALTCGTIELGAASDTNISRDSAGVIAVEGVPIFPNLPQNSQSAAYTLVLADAGKHILHPTADNNARTFTIPANSSVAYPIGTVLTFINLINTVTIAITSDTLYFGGSGGTGSRTLAAYGVATAVKLTSTVWVITGVGLS